MTQFGLQNFTELENNSGHSNLTLLLIGLASVVGMSLYVFFRELLKPNLAIWESDVLIVVFGSLISTAIAYFVLQRNRMLHKRVAAELIEREWTQEALSDSEARYRQLFEANPQPMWVYDLETHKFLAVNEAAVQHYGYSHEEFAQMTTRDVSVIQEQSGESHVTRSLAPCHTSRVCKHRKKNQMLIDVEISSHALDFGGKRASLVLVHDITEVKRVEQTLIESEAELRIMFGAMNDIILVFDVNGKYLKVAPTNAKSQYNSPSELLGKTVHEIFPRDQAEFMLRNIRLALEEKQMQYVEYKLEIGDRTVWFEGGVSPMTNDTVFWISRDISERKQIEEQLRQAQKLESVGQLAAGIAHEINTPLQYVGDNTRFLQDAFNDLAGALEKHSEIFAVIRRGEAVDAKLINQVEAAVRASDVEYLSKEIPVSLGQSLEGIERVTRIVQSIKDFAHPGTAEMKAVNLNKIVESTITVASNEWKYVAEMETNFDESLPPVLCMSGEINQVILNLIINAVHTISDVVGDGSGGKGKIIVQTKRDGDAVEILISDTGKGIPEEIRDKIFNPFFTTKEVGRGTGQGLAIAHRAITKHNGSLTFETEIGRGTTFIIRLPINNVNLGA